MGRQHPAKAASWPRSQGPRAQDKQLLEGLEGQEQSARMPRGGENASACRACGSFDQGGDMQLGLQHSQMLPDAEEGQHVIRGTGPGKGAEVRPV